MTARCVHSGDRATSSGQQCRRDLAPPLILDRAAEPGKPPVHQSDVAPPGC